MQARRAVITGLGVVSPAGNDLKKFLDNLLTGKSFIKPIDRFDSTRFLARHAGVVEDLDADGKFSKRLLKKLDRFSHIALIATDSAISDSGLDFEREDMERVGIILGNALGGWEFAETELRDLYQGGLRDVSPYQATAWFPAAPQGQVSIHYGIKGFAKTIISDVASSLLALGYGARAIERGKADIVIAGGTEAPVSPYALLCCNSSGEMSPSGKYRPFDKGRDGYVIGEGAAVLVIESLEKAMARGARIYAEVKGFGHTSDGMDPKYPDPQGRGLARAMRKALSGAGIDAGRIDCLLPAGLGGIEFDAAEAHALSSVFGDALKNGPSIGIPKALYGNLLGASGAMDAAVACLAMDRGTMPTSTGCTAPEEGCDWANGGDKSAMRKFNFAMVNSVGRGGVNASLVLGKE